MSMEPLRFDEIKRRAADMGETWEPQPLRRDPGKPQPYPVEALGSMAEAVQAAHRVVQSPLALCAQSALSVAALAVQAHRNVCIDGRSYPLSLSLITLGQSGERKSGTDKAFLPPVEVRERELQEIYQYEWEQYKNDRDAYDAARKQALGSKQNKSYQDKQQALNELGPEPKPPLEPGLITSDFTAEGLYKMLQSGQPGVGVFSDEGGIVLGGHAMNNENKLKTLTTLCKLWDGAAIDRTRSGDGRSKLRDRRVSMHLMMQPTVAELLMGDRLANDQGFLPRCLTVYPASTAGQRTYQAVDLNQDAAVRRFRQCIAELLQSEPPLRQGTANELEPRPLELSEAAKQLWTFIHDRYDREMAEGGELETIRAFASKAPEQVLRIAGVLAAFEDLHRPRIEQEHIERAAELVNHYTHEALRLYGQAMVSEDIVLAEKVLAWAQQQEGRLIYPAKVYQRGPSRRIRDKATTKRIMALLEDHGLAKPRAPRTIDGQKRMEVWEVYKWPLT